MPKIFPHISFRQCFNRTHDLIFWPLSFINKLATINRYYEEFCYRTFPYTPSKLPTWRVAEWGIYTRPTDDLLPYRKSYADVGLEIHLVIWLCCCEVCFGIGLLTRLQWHSSPSAILIGCLVVKPFHDPFAARVINLTSKHDHTTPLFKELRWLPVSKRIESNILLLAYKCPPEVHPLTSPADM